MQEVKIYTASPSDLSPPVQSESFCVDMVLASDYAELEEKFMALVATLCCRQKKRKSWRVSRWQRWRRSQSRLCQSPSVFGRPFMLLRAQIV